MKDFKVVTAVCVQLSSLIFLGACGETGTSPADNPRARLPLFEYLGQAPPGETPEVFADEVFSQFDHLHSCPVFSPDGTEAYWAVASRDCRSWYMTRSGDEWSSPQQALFLHDGMGDSPIISPDGHRILFLSQEPTGIDKIRPESIWYVDRAEDGWSEPKAVGDEVNTYLVHWQVSVAENGNLYFAGSKTNPDQRDIVMARLIDGEYSKVTVLGDAINSAESESNPFIDPDEQYLIFSRRRSSGFTDLFISYRRPDGSWTKARSMGRRINTGSHELCANVSRDGKYLFFMSPRDGRDRIYWVDAGIIEDLKPDELK
ncbi:MAG: PD40 domain-containing protein [Phycisphaerales bacterium]|nr:MAG: PD40 domain-containing protein [Phycisphaerales bacterium]